jgi:hypothetical protein
MTFNNSPEVGGSWEQAAPLIDANLRAGLALLRQAHLYALDAGADLWDFALVRSANASLTFFRQRIV